MRDDQYISALAYSVPTMTKILATSLIGCAKAPGSCQYLKPILRPYPPSRNRNGEDKEYGNGDNFDPVEGSVVVPPICKRHLHGQPKFDFFIGKNTEKGEAEEHDPEDKNPAPLWHCLGPEHCHQRNDIVFIGQNLCDVILYG